MGKLRSALSSAAAFALAAWRRRWSAKPRFRIISPETLAVCGVMIVLFYLVLHFSGLRENTSLLSGTLPGEGPQDESALFWGVAYVLAYFAYAIVAPVLLIGAAVFAGIEAVLTRRPGDGGEE
jgi:hypothetical protein